MDSLENSVLLLLFCSVCGLIFHFLLPEGSVSRTAKAAMSLLMLCALCTPIFGVFDHLRSSGVDRVVFGGFGEADTTFPEEQYRRALGEEVAALCGETVKKYTNVPYRITADVHISGDGVISIERIRIVFDVPPEGRDAIETEIKERYGIIPEIKVEDANG